MPRAPPSRALAAPLLACALLAAARLLQGALACNTPGTVCQHADTQCEYCSFDFEVCDSILCSTQAKNCPTSKYSNNVVATCNIWNCNCDPCNGCGPGRPSGGNPSCGSDYQPCRDVGGCDQKCQTNMPSNYKDGNCVACSASAPPGNTTANETCGDLGAFVAMPLSEQTARLSQVLCKSANTSVGDAYTTALLAALDVSGDGVLSCNEYRLSKFTELPKSSLEAKLLGGAKARARSVKLPKPGCKLSKAGTAALAKLVRQLKWPARVFN